MASRAKFWHSQKAFLAMIFSRRFFMSKKLISKMSLSAMMLAEARASGKCPELQIVTALGPLVRPYTNWDYGTLPVVGPDCLLELQKIAGRLQQQYNVH
jgi:hypothetical protein